MRVNRFMLEQKVSELLYTKLKPVFASQIEIMEKIDNCMLGPVAGLRDRIDELEESVFGVNSKSNKL